MFLPSKSIVIGISATRLDIGRVSMHLKVMEYRIIEPVYLFKFGM